MKSAIVSLVLVAAVAAAAGAQTLGVAPPPRPLRTAVPPPVDPEVVRQGGDTWEQAVPIPGVPYFTTGTTVGYSTNCCWSMCPYEAWGPAVFYSFIPAQDIAVRVDLCGSDYDTGLYVYDENQDLVACNIDHYFGPPCGIYVSCIEHVALAGGAFYYIVVTGMSGDSGNYVFALTEFVECVVELPAGAVPEGEPPLADGYLDAFNGGCNSPEFGLPFQALVGDQAGRLLFAGRSGWYGWGYQSRRDTDWFTATVGTTGIVEATLLAERDSYLFELWPQDCGQVDIAQQGMSERCAATVLQVTGEPGAAVWLWVGPTTIEPSGFPPIDEYDYLLTLDGLAAGPVAVERKTWSAVRALYR